MCLSLLFAVGGACTPGSVPHGDPPLTDVMNKVQTNKKEGTKLMVTLLSEARGADRLAGQCDLLQQSIQNWSVCLLDSELQMSLP